MPVFWCLHRISDLISEVNLTDHSTYLGDQEKAAYQKLRFAKRQNEWLGGRLAAKRLMQRVDTRWNQKQRNEIEILSEESGAPYLVISGWQGNPGRVSISHSNGYVFCAYSPNEIQMGVDLELIEPRAGEFARDFFTAKEVDQISTLENTNKILFVTVIWSGKESVLKAISTGLRVDTRSVEVVLPGFYEESTGWSRLGLKSNLTKDNSLSLVWRREGDFVLTVCFPSDYEIGLHQVEFYNNFSSGL